MERILTEKVLIGVPAAGGIAIGPAHLYRRQGISAIRRKLEDGEVAAEVARYREAVTKTRAQISDMEQKMKEKLGAEHAAIFQAHQVVLDDPLFMEEIPESIQEKKLNPEFL